MRLLFSERYSPKLPFWYLPSWPESSDYLPIPFCWRPTGTAKNSSDFGVIMSYTSPKLAINVSRTNPPGGLVLGCWVWRPGARECRPKEKKYCSPSPLKSSRIWIPPSQPRIFGSFAGASFTSTSLDCGYALPAPAAAVACAAIRSRAHWTSRRWRNVDLAALFPRADCSLTTLLGRLLQCLCQLICHAASLRSAWSPLLACWRLRQ
jgi:hypothetical protein